MKASIGRIVTTLGLSGSNGTAEHPAIITRVWSREEPNQAAVLVNLTVLPDLAQPFVRGSVRLFQCQFDAEAAVAKGLADLPVCFWPERV
jgi:hypothetical protein